MAKARSFQKLRTWYRTRHDGPPSRMSAGQSTLRPLRAKVSPFALEALEARVLLSADLATAVPVVPVTQQMNASAVVSVVNATQTTAAVQANSIASPHLSHLRLADFGRSYGESPWRSAASPSRTESAVQWFAAHVDLTESQATVAHFRDYNPGIQSWVYALDLYQFQNEVSGLPESSFLHVSEPTSVTLKDINGNTQANYTIPTGGRFEAAVWMNKHWPFNLKDANLRAYDSNRILNLVGGEAGVFLDAHGSGFSDTFKIGFQTIINSGGGIQEYGGLRPGDPQLDAAYGADMLNWLTQLHGQLASAGKWGILNEATNFAYDQMSRDQAIALGGFETENLIAPDSLRGADTIWNLYDLTQRVTANGGNAIITGKWNFQPAGYTAGSYGSPEARNDMWRLSFYYLTKEAAGSNGKSFFDLTLPSYMTNDIPSDQSHWYAAYQVDVGQPTGGMTAAQRGTSPSDGAPYTVFSRSYTHAKILFRPMDQWSSTDYGDRSAVTVQLDGLYRQVREDATLGPATSSVQIRNAEALILLPASSVIATPPLTPVTAAPAPITLPTVPAPVSAQPTPSPVVTAPATINVETKTVAEMLSNPLTSNSAVPPPTPPIVEPVVSSMPPPAPPVAPPPVTPEPVAGTPPPPSVGERSYTVAEMLALDWTGR